MGTISLDTYIEGFTQILAGASDLDDAELAGSVNIPVVVK